MVFLLGMVAQEKVDYSRKIFAWGNIFSYFNSECMSGDAYERA